MFKVIPAFRLPQLLLFVSAGVRRGWNVYPFNNWNIRTKRFTFMNYIFYECRRRRRRRKESIFNFTSLGCFFRCGWVRTYLVYTLGEVAREFCISDTKCCYKSILSTLHTFICLFLLCLRSHDESFSLKLFFFNNSSRWCRWMCTLQTQTTIGANITIRKL